MVLDIRTRSFLEGWIGLEEFKKTLGEAVDRWMKGRFQETSPGRLSDTGLSHSSGSTGRGQLRINLKKDNKNGSTLDNKITDIQIKLGKLLSSCDNLPLRLRESPFMFLKEQNAANKNFDPLLPVQRAIAKEGRMTKVDTEYVYVLKRVLATLSMPLSSSFSESVFSLAEMITKGRRSRCSIQRLSSRQFVKFNYSSCEKFLLKVLKFETSSQHNRYVDMLKKTVKSYVDAQETYNKSEEQESSGYLPSELYVADEPSLGSEPEDNLSELENEEEEKDDLQVQKEIEIRRKYYKWNDQRIDEFFCPECYAMNSLEEFVVVQSDNTSSRCSLCSEDLKKDLFAFGCSECCEFSMCKGCSPKKRAREDIPEDQPK